MICRIEAKFPDSYRNGNVLMIHGDCMDVMSEIGEKEIPLSIVDPPYGIGADNMTGGAGKNKQWKKGKDWDSGTPDKTYFDKLFIVSKNQIIWGGNYFFDFLQSTKSYMIWDKQNDGRDFAESEFAWSSFDEVARTFRMRPMGLDGGKIHPTQKPVALYKWLLSRYAKHGELILDTHGGSGSIVIACHDLGHPIIWVEKDADYYRDAVARYKTHASQAVLFEPVEIIKEQKLFEEKQ
jgi:site-specific DNA-methyltransferase (adenine-specific)